MYVIKSTADGKVHFLESFTIERTNDSLVVNANWGYMPDYASVVIYAALFTEAVQAGALVALIGSFSDDPSDLQVVALDDLKDWEAAESE